MLKNKSKLIILLIAIIMIVSSTISFATDTEEAVTTTETEATTEEATSEEETTTEETTTDSSTTDIYSGDLYLSGNDVVMDQLVDGNVFIIGGNVEITGRVNGSLFVLADTVTFSENTYIVQTIYACANELTLNGAANDIYAVANTVNMSYNSFIIRDLRIAANYFDFHGGVGRDAFVRATTFNFSTEDDDSAIVYGNLDYSSTNELELSTDFVEGEITYSKIAETSDSLSTKEIILDKVINFLETLFFIIVIFLLIAFFAPNFANVSAKYIGKKTLSTFGFGILGFGVAIALIIALMCSYIGTPLSIAMLALFALMMAISATITITCVTFKLKEVLKIEKKYLTILTLVAVTLALWILEQIPYVSIIISIIVSLVGFGTMICYIFEKAKENKKVEEK